MLSGHGSLILGTLSLSLLSACGSGSYVSESGATSVTAAPPAAGTGNTVPTGFTGYGSRAGTDDVIVATASAAAVSAAVGASRTLSITFASSDGLPMSGFEVSGTLGSLPAGWSGPAEFGCASVDTGSGCVLDLTYAPTAIASGTLTIGYVVVDNSGMPRTNGSLSISYAATPGNNVVAAASPAGQVNAVAGTGSIPVAVSFTTDDGNAATNFVLTTNLATLPAGWASALPALACAVVSTGTGCTLALTYAPAMGGNGILALAYSYTDDTGTAKSDTLYIPYSTTLANNVFAAVSPAGEIIAVQKTGSQTVPITFATDDGKSAVSLAVTTDLTALPAGWSSSSNRFACSSVSTGTGCQLTLTYAPASLASGTFALRYGYIDDAGTTRSGQLDIEYAATTNDNVIGTASPAGPVNAVVGAAGQSATVTFATDDGRPATSLALTSALTALPPGWSSTVGSFTCSALDADNLCQLPLLYTPAAADSGTLSLGYSYANNDGENKTGTVNIVYRATTDDNVVAVPNPNSLAVGIGSSTSVTVVFTTDDGNPASGLSITSALGSLPPGWSTGQSSFGCNSLSLGASCALTLTYAPTLAAAGNLSLDFSYSNDAGIAKTGTVSIPYSAM